LSLTHPHPRPTLFPYTTLFRSLQVKPSADTVALAERIRATAAGSRGSRPARPAAAARRPAGELIAPLVGRAAAFTQVVGSFQQRSEEHTSELQSLRHLVCRLLL